jgi:hypothetical protein
VRDEGDAPVLIIKDRAKRLEEVDADVASKYSSPKGPCRLSAKTTSG